MNPIVGVVLNVEDDDDDDAGCEVEVRDTAWVVLGGEVVLVDVEVGFERVDDEGGIGATEEVARVVVAEEEGSVVVATEDGFVVVAEEAFTVAADEALVVFAEDVFEVVWSVDCEKGCEATEEDSFEVVTRRGVEYEESDKAISQPP